MSERFDRWIANPEEIVLLQAYDEYMLQTELPCLIKYCNWSGKNLSGHVNLAHGIKAKDFKRAAGFNYGTGLVTSDLRECFSKKRVEVIKRLIAEGIMPMPPGPNNPNSKCGSYISREGVEHMVKSYALRSEEVSVEAECLNCLSSFRFAKTVSRMWYCSLQCRREYRNKQNKRKLFLVTCSCCKKAFLGSRGQSVRSVHGLAICCSTQCRGSYNGSKTWKKQKGVK